MAHKRNGDRCGNPAIHGGTVCGYRGGNAPAVKAKARLRLEMASDRLARQLLNMTSDPNVDRQRTHTESAASKAVQLAATNSRSNCGGAAVSHRERWNGPGRKATPYHREERYREWPPRVGRLPPTLWASGDPLTVSAQRFVAQGRLVVGASVNGIACAPTDDLSLA